ncbi:MAG: helix-turn-helix transcriptional regulator [Candidatus Methanomethylophilaceae archaeon]|nr:helix-turn-helix transcriptional regulator [Candidatus Methanomethylophilaceae archaeon]
MSMAENSREMYAKYSTNFDTLRFRVFDLICRDPGLDDQQIADSLNIEINSVTGRVTELRKAGLVSTVQSKNRKGNTARRSYPCSTYNGPVDEHTDDVPVC